MEVMMKRFEALAMSTVFAFVVLLAGWMPASAQEMIDWEGLPAGTYLCGNDPSPDTCTTIQSAAGDPILIDGFDPFHGLDVNAAMIFDSNNPSGGDPDLGSPNETCDFPGPGIGAGGEKGQPFENCPLDTAGGEPLNNVLIISEDLDPTDPDDSGRRGTQFNVDFTQLEGEVTLYSISLLDLEQTSTSVQIFDAADNLIFHVTPLPQTGDNGLVVVEFDGATGVPGVARMVVLLDGSGSLDTILFLQEPPGDPAIDIRKQEEGADTRVFPTGSDVTFTIVVTNTGDVPLTDIVVTDVEAPECDNDAIPDLARGDSFSYECTVLNVTGSFENVACVEGASNGVFVEDCDPSTVEIIDIDIRKQEEGPDSRTFPSGSDVPFEIVVTNTGDEDLVNVVVTDVLVPDCDRVIGDLAAGEVVAYTCTAPNVITSFTNEACVTGERDGVQVGDCDPSSVIIEAVGCTETWGYWKTHSEYGPAPYDDTWAQLPNGADTPFFGTGLTYYEILQASSAGGNKYIGLAQQYIAAELNVLSGASIPPEVLAGWLEAQALLIAYQAELDIPKQTADRELAVQLEYLLDQYNMGVIGPGHCPD
jgi:uncharacterized repeat protein (TIGR01451 family)